MNSAAGAKWKYSLPWILLSAVAVIVLALRLELSFDLSAFFPRQTDLTHEVLLTQFRDGPGSRLLVVGISGASRDGLEATSESLKKGLLDDARFVQVMNGQVSEELGALPAPVDSHYLLMGDVHYDDESLRRAVRGRLRDLAFGGGSAVLDVIARDPFLVTLDVLQGLSAVELSGGPWFTADGTAVLIAETRANAVDIAAQAEAIESIRTAFAETASGGGAAIDITGVGAFGVELQETIRSEATKRTVLATVVLLLVLFAFLRRPRRVLLTALPIGIGYLVGLAVVGAVFGEVHGITLAFGFTLMGVAIDYPLHLLSHSEAAATDDPGARIWPTMRLGALSTAVAYLALAFSGSSGLAQLGVFSASGILVAVLVTRTWLPHLLPSPQRAPENPHGGPEDEPTLRFAPVLVVIAVAVVATSVTDLDDLWDDRLSSLSPVPEDRLSADRNLRAATGAVDMRYQLALHGAGLEEVLERTEDVDTRLAGLADEGHLAAWQSVTRLLPSRETRLRRRERIPPSTVLRERMTAAVAGTPFHEHAFDPFLERAEAIRTQPVFGIDDVRASPLRSWLEAHLFRVRDRWVSLVSLNDPDPERIATRVPDWGETVSLVDLEDASVELMRDYRGGVFRTVSLAGLCIVLLLWYRRRRLTDIAWIGLTVVTSLAATVLILAAVHGQLTVIHLIALLLVTGLGLDYALFMSRAESGGERRASRHAVLVCAVSTILAFGILGGSSIPVLKYLGLTVAVGSAASYLLATAGSRAPRRGDAR